MGSGGGRGSSPRWASWSNPSFPDAAAACQDLGRWVGRSFPLPRPLPSRVWPDPRGAMLAPPLPLPGRLEGQAFSRAALEALIPRASTAQLCPSPGEEWWTFVSVFKAQPFGETVNQGDPHGASGDRHCPPGLWRAISQHTQLCTEPQARTPCPLQRRNFIYLHSWVPFSICVLKWVFWNQESKDSFQRKIGPLP